MRIVVVAAAPLSVGRHSTGAGTKQHWQKGSDMWAGPSISIASHHLYRGLRAILIGNWIGSREATVQYFRRLGALQTSARA